MEETTNSGVIAHLMDSMFRYGTLWIFVEQLEDVARVMDQQGQDRSLIDQTIENGYKLIASIHTKVQAVVRRWHLLVGYCHTTQSILTVDDEMD